VFRTLRHKLIVSYVLIALLSLLLSGSAAAWLLQNSQEESAVRSLRILALSVSVRLPRLPQRQVTLTFLLPRLRQEAADAGVRLVVLTANGQVLADTDTSSNLQGEQIPFALRTDLRRPDVRRRQVKGQDLFFVVLPLGARARPAPPDQPSFVALVVPAADIVDTWLELAPSLLLALALALVVCIAVGGILSRAITRPLEEMTHASQAIAAGDYEQKIATSGNDEVGRLAEAFNHMALEVHRARKTQRDFLANVSHDLKTPLTSIQGFSQALLDGSADSPEDRQRAARIIHQESERMNRLVGELLELSRLESGQIPFRQDHVDVGNRLQHCAEKFRPQAEQGHVDLQIDLQASELAITGDADRLDQVLTNLVDNALRYTPAGGQVLLRGNRERTAQNETWVVIRVSDTGKGISPDDLPHVFERFYRVDRARTKEGGTGLGLAIAREIVQTMGGYIAAQSQLHQGTTFTVRLPAAE